jgi:hypothetical protein
MPLGNWNLQFLNHNSQRAYPLVDWGSKVDQTGSVTIPDSFIVALYFPVHAGHDVEPHKFFIKTLGIYTTGYNIGLGYDDGSADPPVIGAVNIARSTHTENRSYAVAGVDDFDDSVGKVAIGTLEAIDSLPPGQYTFDYEEAGLETDAIRPQIRGITSLAVVTASGEVSGRIYGDIELVAGENMQINVSQVDGLPAQIIFNAIEGEGLNEDCVCEDVTDDQCVTAINGIPPLPDGNFRIIGDDCLDVEPIAHGVQIVDTCSQPCCGCEELDALIDQIDRFADGVVTLQNFVERLGSEVEEMSQVVLGSRLGDQGCVECS